MIYIYIHVDIYIYNSLWVNIFTKKKTLPQRYTGYKPLLLSSLICDDQDRTKLKHLPAREKKYV